MARKSPHEGSDSVKDDPQGFQVLFPNDQHSPVITVATAVGEEERRWRQSPNVVKNKIQHPKLHPGTRLFE
ncbi:hypothetical protein RUM44_005004 [Polyplax serrata]|uniref:Uncharacterized protein n=1 Tax=Polyplax serrata TaxID=468196 RepID=A0ABR1AY69_POLSC